MKTREELTTQIQAHTEAMSQYLDDHEHTWNDENAKHFETLKSLGDALESHLSTLATEPPQDEPQNPFTNRFKTDKTEPKIAKLMSSPTTMSNGNKSMFLNYAGKPFQGLPKSRDPELAEMSGNERLELLGAEMADVQAGRPREFKALATTPDGSAIIREDVLSSLMEVIQQRSAFGRAGCPTISMNSDQVLVPRLNGLLSGQWLAEGEAVKLTSNALDTVTLSAKKVATAFGVTDEYAMAIPGVVNANVTLLADSIAQALDDGMLNGLGTGNFLRGILKYTNADDDINEVAASLFNGFSVDNLTDLVYSILLQDYSGEVSNLACLYSVTSDQAISKWKDANDLPLMNNIAKFSEVRKLTTTKMPGVGSENSSFLLFDPSALLIGVRDGVKIKFSDSAVMTDTEDNEHNAFSSFKQFWRVHTRADVKIVRPQFVSKLVHPEEV